MKTWGLRAAGWALMFLSIQLTMRIVYTLGKQTFTAAVHLHHTRMSWIHLSFVILLCASSGLGSCSQRARVCGAEDLRPECLLLSLPSHHRSGLAFLPTISGCGSGRSRSATGVSRPLTTSSQKE